MRAQQLIEQRAVGVPVVGGAGARGGSEQFDTVADPHLLDQTALDGHDDRDVGQRLLLALQSDPALLAQRGERGECGRIAGAGHLGGQAAPRRGEPQQPVQAGPDHIGADQHQQPGTQMRQRPGGVGADQSAPVRLVLGAAGPPPLLPAVDRTGFAASPAPPAPPVAGSAGCIGCPTRTAPPAPGPATADRRAWVAGHDAATGRGGNAATSCAPVDFTDPARGGATAGATCDVSTAITTRPHRRGSAGSGRGTPALGAPRDRGHVAGRDTPAARRPHPRSAKW